MDIDLDFPVPVAEIDYIEGPGTNCSNGQTYRHSSERTLGPRAYFVPQVVPLILVSLATLQLNILHLITPSYFKHRFTRLFVFLVDSKANTCN